MDYYLRALEKYSDFEGRASRSEFWTFMGVNLLVVAGMLLPIAVEVSRDPGTQKPGAFVVFAFLMVIMCVLFLSATVMPMLAVTVRRLHDLNLAGWLLVLSLVPVLGTIVNLLLFCIDSNPGANRYGENPKGIAAAWIWTSSNHPHVFAHHVN